MSILSRRKCFFRTDDPYNDIEKKIPYAVNWQIKNKLFGRNSSVYMDMNKLAQIINSSGYRGYIPIETLRVDGVDYKQQKLVPVMLTRLKKAFADIE